MRPGWWEYGLVQGTVVTRNGVGGRERKACVGFCIPFMQNHPGETTDLTLEEKAKKKIWIHNIACPQQRNIEAKKLEKLTKYKQLAYKSRERHTKYEIMVVPLVIGPLAGGIKQIIVVMGTIL